MFAAMAGFIIVVVEIDPYLGDALLDCVLMARGSFVGDDAFTAMAPSMASFIIVVVEIDPYLGGALLGCVPMAWGSFVDDDAFTAFHGTMFAAMMCLMQLCSFQQSHNFVAFNVNKNIMSSALASVIVAKSFSYAAMADIQDVTPPKWVAAKSSHESAASDVIVSLKTIAGNSVSIDPRPFSNKEGKIEIGSTRNCVVNVAVIAALTAFMLLVLVFLAAIQVMHKMRCLDANQAAREHPKPV
ncbi:hypothetical protein Tco_1379123 [Tanacetum coccineum]